MSDDPRLDAFAEMQPADVPLVEREARAYSLLRLLDAVDPLRQPGVVCVRLDGLADKIAAMAIHMLTVGVGNTSGVGNSADRVRLTDSIDALLQSLAVQ